MHNWCCVSGIPGSRQVLRLTARECSRGEDLYLSIAKICRGGNEAVRITRRRALSLISGAPALLLSSKSRAAGALLGDGMLSAVQETAAHPDLAITPGPFKGTRQSLRE